MERQYSIKTRYLRTVKNGKPIDVHKKIVLQALGIDSLPKNIIIHHVDGNNKNNDIDNLAVMTITAHNRIHSHPAWNKGITIKTSEKWADTIKKIHIKRNQTFLPLFKEAYDLYYSGKTFRKVGEILGIHFNTALNRVKQYEQLIARGKD